MNNKMKAWKINSFSGVDSMYIASVNIPKPNDDEVLVKISAAAINPFDWYLADGLITGFDIPLPVICGRDGAGVVVVLGKNVTNFSIGDEVYGQAEIERNGTFAEYAVLRQDRLLKKPQHLSFPEASTLPNALYAAWNALFSKISGMDLQQGQRILVHGAGGGIGSLVVQLAKWKGAKVIAVASSKHKKLMNELGVDEYINYEEKDFSSEGYDKIDGIIDTICAMPEEKSYSILKNNGIYISLLKEPDQKTAGKYGVNAKLTYALDSYPDTPLIEKAVFDGVIKPIMTKIITFDEIPATLKKMKQGHTQGKVAINITN